MMKCTEILMKEHDLILERLGGLSGALDQPLTGSVKDIEDILSFITEYADAYHHAKEEEIYFKWMIEKEPGIEHGPIHCMLGEHNQGRELVSKAISDLELFKNGKSEVEEGLKDNLRAFVRLLTDHINKENQVLYMMAEQLNERTQDGDVKMLESFNMVEEKLGESVSAFLPA